MGFYEVGQTVQCIRAAQLEVLHRRAKLYNVITLWKSM